MDPKKHEGQSKPTSKTLSPSRSSSLIPSSAESSSSLSEPSSCCSCNGSSIGWRIPLDRESKRKCDSPCYLKEFYDDDSKKSIMNTWLTFLSLLCAVSCAFVMLTFFIDITRFKYPQRPIIFLALCYFFVSCGYLVRVQLGHENVACKQDPMVNTKQNPTDLLRNVVLKLRE